MKIGKSEETYLFYIVLSFFVFMMLYKLLHSAPWGDEWVEYTVSQRGIRDGSLYKSIIRTYQPPLYNVLMHFWLKIGKTILWFRLFNVLCGTVSGIFLYKTVYMLTNYRFAIGTLFVLSVTYYWVYCIQECSEYTLMLMFLFLGFYFYIKVNETDNLSTEILFILSCVCAIYSQYGAFFIVVPLLFIHWTKECFVQRWENLKRTSILYLISFIIFAVPLYFFFAKRQIENNAITENSKVVMTLENIKSFPIVFGKLIGYFSNINDRAVLSKFIIIFGIIILSSGITIQVIRSTSWVQKSLSFILLTAYSLFYWLVIFKIYAMVHPDESLGFYSRYAFFFIPVFCVTIPMIIYELRNLVKVCFLKKWITRFFLSCIFASTLVAFPKLLNNWHKSYDREFSEIWVKNAGFNETTYLIGVAKYGFEYYIAQYNCRIMGEVLASDKINLEDLPDSFWIWRTNWGGEMWQQTVDKAFEEGYKVVIYADYGEPGQLAYCTKWK